MHKDEIQYNMCIAITMNTTTNKYNTYTDAVQSCKLFLSYVTLSYARTNNTNNIRAAIQ